MDLNTDATLFKGTPGEIAINEKDGAAMVWVPGGQYFTFGGEEGWTDQKPPFEAKIMDGFWLYQTPVTNQQYGKFLSENPDYAKPAYWENRRFNHTRQPVVGIGWEDVAAYCTWTK